LNTPSDSPKNHLRARLRALYFGDSTFALRFRFGLLAFDFITILFFVISTMLEPSVFIYAIDYAIAAILALDFWARASLETDKKRWARDLYTWLDIIVILSLLASMLTDNLMFLRVIRTLRLLRSYHMLRDLRRQFPWFNANQDIIRSSFNLSVFVFFITAWVYVVEHGANPDIRNYMDALYYTISTLTTTGFGDITLKDTPGRVLSIIIMVVGVSLFLRLVQTIFQPPKVRTACPDCGLQRHDRDAVHCKHCGLVLNISTEGL
jgi:voltage-gated potassium channel